MMWSGVSLSLSLCVFLGGTVARWEIPFLGLLLSKKKIKCVTAARNLCAALFFSCFSLPIFAFLACSWWLTIFLLLWLLQCVLGKSFPSRLSYLISCRFRKVGEEITRVLSSSLLPPIFIQTTHIFRTLSTYLSVPLCTSLYLWPWHYCSYPLSRCLCTVAVSGNDTILFPVTACHFLSPPTAQRTCTPQLHVLNTPVRLRSWGSNLNPLWGGPSSFRSFPSELSIVWLNTLLGIPICWTLSCNWKWLLSYHIHTRYHIRLWLSISFTLYCLSMHCISTSLQQL